MTHDETFVNRLIKVATLNFYLWVDRGTALEVNKFNRRAFVRHIKFQQKYNIQPHLMFDTSNKLFLAAKYLLYTATHIANRLKLDAVEQEELVWGNVEDLFTAVAFTAQTGATIDDIHDALVSADDSFMVDSRIRYINMMMQSQKHQYN